MPPTTLQAVLAVYRVHWGFSSRAPWGSIVQPSYILPPPTTIVGALAQAAYRLGLLGGGEFIEENGVIVSGAYRFIQEFGVKWVTAAWLTPAVRTGIPIAYFSAPYRSHLEAQNIIRRDRPVRELFSFYEIGYTVSPHGLLAILVVVDSRAEDTARIASHVTRIGSKESFVDAIHVAIHGLKPVERVESQIVTAWMTLSDCASIDPTGNYVEEKAPIPLDTDEWLAWYKARGRGLTGKTKLDVMKKAVEPQYPGWARLKPSSRCSVVYAADEQAKVVVSTTSIRLNKPLKTIIIPQEVWKGG